VATRVAAAAFLAVAFAAAAAAGDSGTLVMRAGKIGGPYHALARELVESVAKAPSLGLTLDLEESQSSAQNIIDAVRAERPPVFTAPPSLVLQASKGEKPFEPDPGYGELRSLFTIPYQTMHWVVRADGELRGFRDLAGAPFVPGTRGSVSERQTAAVLKVLDLESKVPAIEIDPAAAIPALVAGKIAGFAMAGPFPLPAITDLARTTPIRLLGLRPDEAFQVLGYDDGLTLMTIPKGTYPGVDQDVVTVALPVGVYTTSRLGDDVAYALTKAFWTRKSALERDRPEWRATTPETLAVLGAKLHPGALRYYAEAGIDVPAALK
jgi:TRAP transporter TAXI family solute receptor